MARSTKGLYKRGPVWWMTYRDALGQQRYASCRTGNKEDAEKKTYQSAQGTHGWPTSSAGIEACWVGEAV